MLHLLRFILWMTNDLEAQGMITDVNLQELISQLQKPIPAQDLASATQSAKILI
ncbi:hypothetical protein EXN66_Car007890 [Channa argus]|uniref:Uncharacterized protein n=1 Tax=Channa argus TaxID=215402 RepID=A0A6G1PPY9_CHAAH|nr:hypothetical protein EXN66_Car007890 [Channa argus]